MMGGNWCMVLLRVIMVGYRRIGGTACDTFDTLLLAGVYIR